MARLQSATQHFKNAPIIRGQVQAKVGSTLKLGSLARAGVETSVSADLKTGAVTGQATGEVTVGGRGGQVQVSMPLVDSRGILPENPTVTAGFKSGESSASQSGEVTLSIGLSEVGGLPIGVEVGVDFSEVGHGLADLGAALGEGIQEAFRQQDQQEQMTRREPCQGSSPHCN